MRKHKTRFRESARTSEKGAKDQKR